MISKLGIATRLWLLVALLLAWMGTVAALGGWQLHAAQQRGAEHLAAIRQLVDRQEAFGSIEDLQRQVRAGEARLLAVDAAELRSAALLQVGLLGFALLASALCARLLVASVRAPLREVIQHAMRIADGDLSGDVRVFGKNETARLMQATAAMTAHLRALVREVAERADVVAHSSGQVSQGHADLSQRTEEQAAALEETASQMEELTSTVALNADNALRASELAGEAATLAGRGGSIVTEVVSTMGRISESSVRIAEITGVIDGIAFQTNILALNAAVEAARAGEHGRGFAVVAAEVRTLSERSAHASGEIKQLIASSVAQVDGGARLVADAGAAMGEIVESVRQVHALVAEIAAASTEQSVGISQVNTAVAQMDQVVQQNAALVEEAAAAMEAMREQAQGLRDAVGRFRLGQEEAAPVLPGRLQLA
ncbi:methyl-accepting chemotaxis protein [Ramlibacter sp. PS3R-8]|uniref:methyl-accepting chemotaxis protein n=1 Tax=Ramlibacter sp. PS3R-8 TaxID=3133437 RepID=UPI003094C793